MKIPADSLRRVIMAGGLAGIAGALLLLPGLSIGAAGPPKQQDDFTGRILRGWVELRPMGTACKGGTLHVYVEKGPQDRPAKVLMELVQPNFVYGGKADEKIPFALGPFDPRPGTSYRVRVHVDADGDNLKSFGDYFKVTNIFKDGSDRPIVITADFINQRGVQIQANRAGNGAAVVRD